MKDNFGKIESVSDPGGYYREWLKLSYQSVSSLETVLQCQVCIELLHRPYAYVFCNAMLVNESKPLILQPVALRPCFLPALPTGMVPKGTRR